MEDVFVICSLCSWWKCVMSGVEKGWMLVRFLGGWEMGIGLEIYWVLEEVGRGERWGMEIKDRRL